MDEAAQGTIRLSCLAVYQWLNEFYAPIASISGSRISAESAVVGFGRRQSVDQADARNSQTSVAHSAFCNLAGTLTSNFGTNHYALRSLLSWLGSYYCTPNPGSCQAAFLLPAAAAWLPPHLLSWAS